MLKERANVLAKIKEVIKLFGFKTSDFKGVLATRKKRGTGTPAKRTVAKKRLSEKAMAKGRLPLAVPKLTPYEVKLA
jgi:hypothetical protein